MIYGYETPNLFPVKSLYDDGMMKMYADAVKSEYERGLADLKEFISKYGDFVTPFAADAEEWNKETIYKVQDALLAMQAQGVDPFRNREAQAMMGNVFRNINYGNIGRLKLSAKVGEQYLKLLAAGVAEGKLDPAVAAKLDGDFRNWNTLNMGVWNTQAPTAQRSVNEVLAPYIEDLYKRGYEEDKSAMAKSPGYIIRNVSDKSILDQLNKAAYDIMRDPMMQYRAKSLGYVDEQGNIDQDAFIKEELFPHMRSELKEQKEMDKVYFENRDYAEKVRHNKQMENIATIRANNAGKVKSGNSKNGGSGISSITRQMYEQGIFTSNFDENRLLSNAMALTDKAFAKYKDANGNVPSNIRSSSAYRSRLAKNYKAVIASFQRDKINKYVQAGGKANNAALAFSSGVGTAAITSAPSINKFAQYDTNGNIIGYDIPKDKLVTLQYITNKMKGSYQRPDENGKYITVKNNLTEDSLNTGFTADNNNFIQIIDRNNRVRWYFKTDSGLWYDYGVYEENVDKQEHDKEYLNTINQSTKALESVVQDTYGNYIPDENYDLID